MPSKNFYLNDAQSEVLTAKWGLFFRKFEILYNGDSLGMVPNLNSQPNGTRYPLPDGRVVTAQLVRSQGLQQLQLLIDKQPVPGSATHPIEQLKAAWYTLLVVGVLNVIIGLIADMFQVDFLQQIGVGWGSAVEGVIYLALGWFGHNRRSAPAFTAAFALLVVEGVAGFAMGIGSGNSPGIGGIFLRFFICVMVFRGIKAAKQLRSEETALLAEPM
ncbi:hypothetical protein [Hymenobacter arizonensis]|uniref:Uncharacterized protein n=1 Tax=Hymenobacter arizonensis TaxID=1227077 RepID=A0A1I5Z409_HYMAR|nr:hypothetical protein [Hymenobacter arizonensis]SFQ51180.1 hypothetical protein SAMN04515668_2691 [Hymenobacter arizonensis]